MVRTILHADLDAFYASVEQLDRPELRGRPVLVGGRPEDRGVVAAASYEARRYGARSAMPMSRALRLCPNAVHVPPRFDRYIEISRQVMDIFRTVTPVVEPLSLDEAYLDATGRTPQYGGAGSLARHIKHTVRETTRLTVSIGVGANKTVAKVASDAGKPDGLVVVPPGGEATFLAPRPVRELSGIGPKAERALAEAGIRTIGDLANAGDATVERLIGSRGAALRRMAAGNDDRPVVVERERKSIGAETTFAHDLADGPDLRAALDRLTARVAGSLSRHESGARTVALKLRYHDFRTITRQCSVETPIDDVDDIRAMAERLLDSVVAPGDRFRLIGVQCSGLVGETMERQLSLWRERAAPSTGEGAS